jgi:predicted phosphodiesterase
MEGSAFMPSCTRHPAVVIRPTIEPGRRVLAISDIHGNLPFLKGVLEKARFSQDDVLVLVGDLLEKGKQSLDVLRFLMELQKNYTVYPLCGNCDHIDREFLDGEDGVDHALWPVFQCWQDRSVLFQMGTEIGLRPEREEDLPAFRQALLEHFPQECDFLRKLPHILVAGNFIFVHGGIPREDRLEELEAYACMKNDNFLGQGLSFHKWVVVGHWPVTLYRTDIPIARPLISAEQHIISIDGGCVLKLDGQLNALIIPDINGDAVDYVAYDGLPVVRALDRQEASADSLNIRWSDSAVEVLRKEGDCAWCRHISTGRELWIPSEFLYPRRSDCHIHCEDSTDYCLPVKPGDQLTLVRKCDKGYLVKKDGVSGWYHGKVTFS